MGIALGLFVNGYVLASLFPASSRQLLVLTGVIVFIGAPVYWLLLAWSAPRLAALPGRARLDAVIAALLAGVVLFFAGTAGWLTPPRYISILLPAHRLELQAAPTQTPRSLALTWFTTSVGDVSYSELDIAGWKRSGDELVLEQPDGNHIRWSGRTGGDVQLRFRSSQPGESVTVSWDGHEETLLSASGKFTYARGLGVPWYASSGFVYALGMISFASLALMVFLWLWPHRAALGAGLEASVSGSGAWDRSETLFLLSAAAIALILRVLDLGRAYPAVDEYFHLIAARQLVEGASLSSVYGRSLWIVTVPVSLAFRAFGYQLWAARLVGAFVDVLGVWPLYLLARKISKPVGVLSVLLFATSPWVVTFARITREYAYYPVFVYFILLGMISFIGRVPQGFVILRDWRTLLRGRTLLVGLALLIPPVFAFFVDPSSTFRLTILAYIVFAAFLLARLDWKHRLNLPLLAVFAAAVLVAGYAAYLRDAHRLVPVPRFNLVPLLYFFPNPPQQWYFDRFVLLAVVALIAAGVCGYVVRRVNSVPFFVLCLYLTYLMFFTFLSKKFFHTRHLSMAELWYIVLLAAGLYFCWTALRILQPGVSRVASLAVAAVLLLSLMNVGQIALPVASAAPNNVISEDYLHDMSPVQAFMASHAQTQDALISTVYGLYNSWVETPRFAANYRITTQTPLEQVLGLIEQHESGWIVVDQIRLDMSAFGPHAFAGNPDVEYIGLFGDQNVWHWQHASGTVGHRMVAGKAE
jgi:hypothetical protein